MTSAVRLMSDARRSKRWTARLRAQGRACKRRHDIGQNHREYKVRENRLRKAQKSTGARRHRGAIAVCFVTWRLFVRTTIGHFRRSGHIVHVRHFHRGHGRVARFGAQRPASHRQRCYRSGDKDNQYGSGKVQKSSSVPQYPAGVLTGQVTILRDWLLLQR